MLIVADQSPLVSSRDADSLRLIVADLHALITRIDRSMRLIDAALVNDSAPESGVSSGAQEGSIEIFVLDDVTPRYLAASAALSACRAGLGCALQDLSETGK